MLIAIARHWRWWLRLRRSCRSSGWRSLFKERASLDQSYDVGHLGRFGRHVLGALLALDQPFGIGPLQFHKIFPEDPHNTYLNAFLSGGWLSGFAISACVATTLALGLRFVFVARRGGRPISRSTAPSSGWRSRASSSTATTGATTSWCSA